MPPAAVLCLQVLRCRLLQVAWISRVMTTMTLRGWWRTWGLASQTLRLLQVQHGRLLA
jgi:hypothetical protein